MNQAASKSIVIWLLSGSLLILLMVTVGGITRLTQSGLSMAHWSVSGSLPPMTDEQWLFHFEKYKQTPEYNIINKNFSLSDFKSIFWWEYIHRMLGRTIGFVFIVPFITFLVRRKLSRSMIIKCSVLLLVGGLQGFLGWYMVKSGLVDKPHVDHLRLAIHLFTALIAFSLCVWFASDLITNIRRSNNRIMRKLIITLLVLVAIQIIYGAFVSGLKAGYIFNSFPKMDSVWIADDVFRLKPFYQNFLFNGAGVQFIHRCLGISILLFSLYILYNSEKKVSDSSSKLIIRIVCGIVLLQFTLGLITLLFQVPLFAAVMHQTVAFILVASVLIAIRFS